MSPLKEILLTSRPKMLCIVLNESTVGEMKRGNKSKALWVHGMATAPVLHEGSGVKAHVKM